MAMTRIRRRRQPLPRLLFAAAAAAFLLQGCFASARGIPGTTQTESGYDTELGTDPICWRSQAAAAAEAADNKSSNNDFPNPLVEGFSIRDGIQLLRTCPQGITLTATPPKEFNEKLRVKTSYQYSVTASIDLNALNGTYLVSDHGPCVAVQILVCELGNSGFCSPFIHEQSNERLAARNMSLDVDDGDRHGGTHVHSPFYQELLPRRANITDAFYNFSVDIDMVVNEPGSFFAVAAVQLYMGNEPDGQALFRYDIANALPPEYRLISYVSEAEVLVVSKRTNIILCVFIGMASSIILFLLVETIRHRHHQVLKLTQVNFLIVFLTCALIATACSFLLNPQYDIYCLISRPLVLIPEHILFSIVAGRLWRINAVISPLLVEKLKPKSQIADFLQWVLHCGCRRQQSSSTRKLRRSVPAWQLTCVVIILCLPQLAIQGLALSLQPLSRDIDFNEDESIGRAVCRREDDDSVVEVDLWLFPLVALVLLILFLVFLAQSYRNLPSLFNESQVIFETAISTFILLVLGFAIILVTDEPTTSPEVEYIVWVAVTLSTMVNASVRIMLPKLRMVWRNETVIVSKLVTDQRKSVMGGPSSSIRPSSVACPTTIITSPKMIRQTQQPAAGAQVVEADGEKETLTAIIETPENDSDHHHHHTTTTATPIRITRSHAPTRRFVLELVELQEQLALVNSRLFSGLAVPDGDWDELREKASLLGHTFDHEVEFEWDGRRNSNASILRPRRTTISNASSTTRDPAMSDGAECVNEGETTTINGEGHLNREASAGWLKSLRASLQVPIIRSMRSMRPGDSISSRNHEMPGASNSIRGDGADGLGFEPGGVNQ